MVRLSIHVTDIWLFCSQAGQAASFNKVRWTRNWNTSNKTTLDKVSATLVVKLDVSIGIASNVLPNLLYVTYLHDVLYVCATSSCFCSPKGTIMKIRSILTCIMLSLPLYLNCKTFRCVYCFL